MASDDPKAPKGPALEVSSHPMSPPASETLRGAGSFTPGTQPPAPVGPALAVGAESTPSAEPAPKAKKRIGGGESANATTAANAPPSETAHHLDDSDTASRVVEALQSDAPLIAALWPGIDPSALLGENRPAPSAFAGRWQQALRWINAVARRDTNWRQKAEQASQRLQEHRKLLFAAWRAGSPDRAGRQPELEELAEYAFVLFARHQEREFLSVALPALLGGAPGTPQAAKVLYSSDAPRLDYAAAIRGIPAARVRELLREEGIELREVEARSWAPFPALPGNPTTLDGVADAMLANVAHAAVAIRSGALTQWLAANGASPALQKESEQLRTRLDGGTPELVVVHLQAWSFGRLRIALGTRIIDSPSVLVLAIREGAVAPDVLEAAGRIGLLGEWLRRHDRTTAAAAGDLFRTGDPSAFQRLRWALGEPFVLYGQSFTDAPSMAHAALERTDLREALLGTYRSGALLAWLESLPPAARDEDWIELLRRAAANRFSDELPLWLGAYARTGSKSLSVRDRTGNAVVWSSLEPLRITSELASHWDALKALYRSGELLAWLTQITGRPEVLAHQRALASEDAGLNQLLWECAGHTGLVLEWGTQDFPVSSLGDLAVAYLTDWQRFEAQLQRGYVLEWILRFHKDAPVGTRTLGAIAPALFDEPRLPSGVFALRVALLCGLKTLPVNPREPGSQAAFLGYEGVGTGPGASASLWTPLAERLQDGSVWLWLALTQSKEQPPRKINELLLKALNFRETPTNAHYQSLFEAFGAPIPTQTLQMRMTSASLPAAPPAPPPPSPPQAQPQNVPTNKPVAPPSHAVRNVLLTLLLLGALGGGAYFGADWWFSRRSTQRPLPPIPPTTPIAGSTLTSFGSCTPTSTPLRVGVFAVPERGLSLASFGDGALLGWVANPTGRTESAALSLIDASGTSVRPLALEAGGNATGPRMEVQRSFSVVVPPGMPSPSSDRIEVHEREQTVAVRCGSFVSAVRVRPGAPLAAGGKLPDDPTTENPQRRAGVPVDPRAVLFCRTVPNTRPFVLALRSTSNGRSDPTTLELVAFAGNDATAGIVQGTIRLNRVSNTRVTARELLPALRQRVALPDDIDTASVPGVGTAYAFRVQGRVYAGWVSELLQPVGNMQTLGETLTDVGSPRVVAQQREAWVYFTARPPAATGNARVVATGHRVFAAHLLPNDPVPAVVQGPLELANGIDVHAREPSAAGLPDGTWILTWSQVPRSGDGMSSVWFQRLQANFTAAEPPVMVSLPDRDTRAPRVVANGARFTLATLTGTPARAVDVLTGTCGPVR